MTREEMLALAERVGPDTDQTDSLDFIRESKGLVLVNDEMYSWDEATQDFVSIEN